MNTNTNSSEGALKFRNVLTIATTIVITGTYVGLYTANNLKLANNFKENENKTEIEMQVAELPQTTNERQFATTSREAEERIIEEPKEEYISIDEIEISRNMDLTVRCGVSRDDFISLMENLRVDYSGFFEENAGTIYDLCKEYELNEIFFCGLIAAESSWKISSGHRNAHNYISMMSGGRLIRYSSDEEGLEAAAKLLHNRYLTEGGSCYYGKTLSSVQKRFCPNSSTWVGLVYGCMKYIV